MRDWHVDMEMQFLGMVEVQLKPSYYLVHTSIPAWCCVFYIHMAPTCQKNDFPTGPLFVGHTQEFKSLSRLLCVDPGSMVLNSVLCHQPDSSSATPPAKWSRSSHGSHDAQILPTRYQPWGKQPTVELPFPKLSSSLPLIWNTYFFIQLNVLWNIGKVFVFKQLLSAFLQQMPIKQENRKALSDWNCRTHICRKKWNSIQSHLHIYFWSAPFVFVCEVVLWYFPAWKRFSKKAL